MNNVPRRRILALTVLALASIACRFSTPVAAQTDAERTKMHEKIRASLLFHASFDRGVDADFAKGDGALWTAPAIPRREAATRGLPAGEEVTREADGGRFGGALRFRKSAGPMVFYKAPGNFPAPAPGWSGTVSFWLSTDPQGDLAEGFCDPIQITSKQWDDASFFVEFEKRATGIPFRLGVYADKSVWNPQGRKFEDIPPAERPLATVNDPPFLRDRWTHVAFTFTRFNSGRPDGLATLYLNGLSRGAIADRTQTFTWDPSRTAIMLGLSYIGRLDDLSLFDRDLAPEEIAALYSLPRGIGGL